MAVTLFVAVKEQGAVIPFDVETEQALQIEAAFHGDFQLEWPAALGGNLLGLECGAPCLLFRRRTERICSADGLADGR